MHCFLFAKFARAFREQKLGATMKLKKKLKVLATEKITKRVIHKDKVDDAINSVLTRIGKSAGQKTAEERAKELEKNYLVIKAKSYSLGTMIGTVAELFAGMMPDMGDYLGRYQILDSLGEIKYLLNAENTIVDREILNLYDAAGNKIGYVKEHVLPMGIPLLEKEVKECSVYLGKEKIAELRKYISFGNLEFEMSGGYYKITHNEGKQFKIYHREKLLATLYDVPLNLKDGYADKFVMEYDDALDETMAILFAIGLDLINK